MSSEHITYMGHAECFLTYSWLALAMRIVLANFVALLTCNAVSKRCVFVDLYTWFINNTLYIRLKLAGYSHILTKLMDAQRRTVLISVTQGVGCASYMCDSGIRCAPWIDQFVLSGESRFSSMAMIESSMQPPRFRKCPHNNEKRADDAWM